MEHEDSELGRAVAARLKNGSRRDYDLVQMLVIRAQKTQEWVFGDMIMRIVWALLPDEAQEASSKQRSKVPDGVPAVRAIIRKALRAHLGEDIFASWFRTLEFEHFDGKTATFSAPVKFIASWIKYREELLLACRAAFGTAQAIDVIVRRPGTRDLHT
jgi:hypothetical protein